MDLKTKQRIKILQLENLNLNPAAGTRQPDNPSEWMFVCFCVVFVAFLMFLYFHHGMIHGDDTPGAKSVGSAGVNNNLVGHKSM
jgi:hypothetical protein